MTGDSDGNPAAESTARADDRRGENDSARTADRDGETGWARADDVGGEAGSDQTADGGGETLPARAVDRSDASAWRQPHDAGGVSAAVRADTIIRLRAAGCVFAEDEADLLLEAAGVNDPARLAALVDRRVAGEPLEHVVGWAEFGGLRIAVGPGAFVPRRRSEYLLAQALQVLAGYPGAPVVVDLCCGTGAIAAALAHARPGLRLHAADIDPAQTAWARRNLDGVAAVHEGDLYAALPTGLRGHIDVITANAPYVPTARIATLPAEARDHESPIALDGGPDGTGLHHRIAAEAPGWLRPGGHLLIETSPGQVDRTAAAFAAAGLDWHVVEDDELETAVVVGRRPAGS